jgi:hypothetical protein
VERKRKFHDSFQHFLPGTQTLRKDELAQNKTTDFLAQTAEYWLSKGVFTVPLRSRSKRPKGRDWPHLRLVQEDFNNGAFKPGDNIGALWGEASDHATDIDLDLEEAVEVAPHILPETFMYGRTDKEDSHYVYRIVGAETHKWQVSELGTIIEIRSTGAQSVIPPSKHPDGGNYFSDDMDAEFAELTKLEMERYADEIAVAAVFTRFYPTEGSRHDYVHACTGALCHQEWQADKIKRVMAAVLTVIQDDEDELADRKGSVVNTIEKHNAGDRTKGFTTLQDWISMPVISALRRWTESGKDEGKVVLAPANLKPTSEKLEFDESLLDVPGLIGDASRWACRESFVDQPIFGLAAGIMCTAVATCNHYIVQHWKTPLQPYLMVTAPTGGGKAAVIRAIRTFGYKMQLDEVIFRGFQSYYVMLDVLAEGSMACWLWDEAARYMAAAKNSNSPDYTTLSHVISLYGEANSHVSATPGRKQSIPALDYPFLTVLATAQPEQLMEALTSVASETGFVNRFILLDTGTEFRGRNLNRSHVFPSAITKQAKQLRDHEPADGQFTEVTFADTRTYSAFDKFEETSRRRAGAGQYSWARANQNALILAGLAAVGVDAHRPVIDIDLCRWAIDLVSWSNNCWEAKVRSTASGESYIEKDSFKIEAIINNPQKYVDRANSDNQRNALQHGFTPKSVITRNTRGIDKKRREQILDDLHDAGLINSAERFKQIVYFPTPLSD